MRSSVRCLRFLLAVFSGVVLSCGSLQAQSTELGNVSGNITDPAGAVISGANVKVTNQNTGVVREITSDASGNFAARSLTPGIYRVEVSSPSFSTQVQENIKLDVNATVNLNFHLTVGQVNQRVEVQAQGALLQTEESSVGTLISNAQIVEMPLNGRNFNNLTRLTPGAVRGTSAAGETLNGETYAVAGSRSDNSYFALDGMFNNGSFFKTAAISPSIDAIQEFKISSNTGAQFGAAAGANINIMIKPGGNQYHGTIYEFFRNDKLDSRSYFSTSKPAYRQNQFGFTVGGPVTIPKLYDGKDKTFWFFNYEGNRIRNGNASLQAVPTPAMTSGDLSRDQSGALASAIFDPASTRLNPATGTYVRTPFANNQIPASRIKPYASAYTNFWFPTNLIPGQIANYLMTNNTSRDDDQINLRVDHHLSDKDNFYARFSKQNLNQVSPGSLARDFQGTYNNYVGAVLNNVYLFNPNTILNFRFGYLRADLGQGPTTQFVNVYRQAGLTNTPEKFRSFDYPIGFGIAGFAGPATGNLVNGPDFTYQGSISLNKVIGRHSFTLGYDLTRLRIFHDSVFTNFGYTALPTSDPQNVNNTGQALASFLLGLPSTASRIVGEPDLDLRQVLHHTYIQDDFKVSPKLTVNLGLRWEYDQWPHHIRGRLSGFDSITGQLFWASRNPITGQPPNVREQVADPRYRNFAPRIGFAYRVAPNTTLRSSYGIFYNSNFSWEWSSSRGGWPFSVSDNIQGLNLPGSALTPTENLFLSFNPAAVVPNNQHTVSRDLKTPYMQNWNFGVEHQFARDLLLEINYQGSKGTHLSSFLNGNNAAPGPGNPELRRPFPQANGAYSELKNIATSKYNALTVKAEKRLSRGFSLLASYAWGHAIDLNSEFGGQSPQDSRCIRCDLGNSGFDQRHVFNASYIYVLPGGNSQNGFVKYLLGGWEVAGITTLESGRAFNLGINRDNANDGGRSNNQRPNLVGDPFPSGFQQTYGPGGSFFNTAAFAFAPQFTYGNLGRNALRGPAFYNTDLGAFKNFSFTERLRLQFRAEFFNIFNNTQFNNPNTTLGDRQFGSITSVVNRSRQIQFGLKLNY